MIKSLDHLKKSYYYLARNQILNRYQLNLSFIFHTESIFDEAVYNQLTQFLIDYRSLTGTRAICCIMPASTPRIRSKLEILNIPENLFIERVHKLTQICHLGYHGHYWIKGGTQLKQYYEMRSNNFIFDDYKLQLEKDLAWFKDNQIDHNGIYTAGWWFTNPQIYHELINNGFILDASVSKFPWCRNQATHKIVIENNISCGEPFSLNHNNKEILCIQNLLGCHDSANPAIFEMRLCSGLDKYFEVTSFVNSHDYDLFPKFALNCIDHLIKNRRAKFLDVDELIKKAKSQQKKSIQLY